MIGVGLWLLGALLLWRPAARAVRREFVDSTPSLEPDGFDLAMVVFAATFLAMFWPVWIVPAVFVRRVRGSDVRSRILAITGESRAEKLKRAQERVAELEQELSVR
jgi:hypothetical protein